MLLRLITIGLAAAALGPAAPAADSSVMIMDYRYDPASPTLTVGDSVTWTNHDQVPHDVAGTSGPAALQSPELGQGESWSHTFAAAGTYDYICSFHPDMTASITVEPVAVAPTAPPSAPPPAPGVDSPGPLTEGTPEPTQPPAPTATTPSSSTPSAPAATPSSTTPTTIATSPDEELAARPVASESRTSLPPLAVGIAVAAVVLACIMLLLGGSPHPTDPTLPGAPDDPTLPIDD